MYRDSPARAPRSDEEALLFKQRKAMLYRRRRVRFIVGLAAACILIIVIVVVGVAASRNSSQLTPGQLLGGDTKSPTAPVSATSEERPAFARFGDRNLLLPVAAADATIIAYQPVSDTRTVALTPVGQRVNVNGFVRFFRDLFSGTPSMRWYQLAGADNAATTSVLVGAQPDTPVTSPVSGVVARVREYLLFGKYNDVQIDIRPEEMGGTTVTLLFINNPAVTPGMRVEAGKTLLGTVRRCPEEIAGILAAFTHDSGSHVNLQVTEEPIR
jgi:hypothetical protein